MPLAFQYYNFVFQLMTDLNQDYIKYQEFQIEKQIIRRNSINPDSIKNALRQPSFKDKLKRAFTCGGSNSKTPKNKKASKFDSYKTDMHFSSRTPKFISKTLVTEENIKDISSGAIPGLQIILSSQID